MTVALDANEPADLTDVGSDPEKGAAKPTPRARVLVVDDHHTFSDLLVVALESQDDFECVGTAATAADAVRTAVHTKPDLVVMDLQLGADCGLQATRDIHAHLPETVIVVVTAYRDPAWLARATQAGASAFVPKSGSLHEMLSALRSARRGSMFVAPSLFEHTGAKQVAPPREHVERLTAREQEVLVLMGKGVSPREIARILNISLNTCRGYVKVVHTKLGVRSQLEAVVKAQRLGIIAVDES